MSPTDVDSFPRDQVEVTFLEREVMLGVAGAFAVGWHHAVMWPWQARDLAGQLMAAAKYAEREDGR